MFESNYIFEEMVKHINSSFKAACGTRIFNNEFLCGNVPFVLRKYKDNIYSDVSNTHLGQLGLRKHMHRNEYPPISSLISGISMAFNSFGSKSVKFLENDTVKKGTYDIHYNYQIAEIATTAQHKPMEIDACLFSSKSDSMLCFNFNCLDWIFTNPKALKASYLDAARYNMGSAAGVFVDLFRNVISDEQKQFEYDYESLFECLDAAFVIKQAAALYSCIYDGMLTDFSDISLILCRWTVENISKLSEDTAEFYNMKNEMYNAEFDKLKEIVKPICELFEKNGIRLNIIDMTYKDLMSIVEMDSKKAKYLQRYIV